MPPPRNAGCTKVFLNCINLSYTSLSQFTVLLICLLTMGCFSILTNNDHTWSLLDGRLAVTGDWQQVAGNCDEWWMTGGGQGQMTRDRQVVGARTWKGRL